MKLKPFVLSLCVVGAMGTQAFAVVTAKSAPKKEEATAQKDNSSADQKKLKSTYQAPKGVGQTIGSLVGGTPVVIGPFIGDSPQADGSDLIVNAPSVNDDLALLRLRKEAQDKIATDNLPSIDHPRLLLSGRVEGQAMYDQQGTPRTDIDLTAAELDSLVEVTPWATGFMTFNYDNSIMPAVSPNRINNSRLFVNKAFIVMGDLDKSPFYGSIGQLYVPFGQFSSALVSAPLTQSLGRVKARAVTLNYAPKSSDETGPFGSVYAYRSAISPGFRDVNEGGANLGFQYHASDWSGKAAVGMISNMADAGGAFPSATSGFLKERIPGLDANAHLAIGPFGLLGEYVTATTAYDPSNLTFNNPSVGAKPSALHLEADYGFHLNIAPLGIKDQLSSVALAFGASRQALAFGLPAERYTAVFNTSFIKDTLESIEYHHDVNYASGDNSMFNSSSGLTGTSSSGTTSDGKPDNAVIGSMDIYF